jgi:hypothetical protein
MPGWRKDAIVDPTETLVGGGLGLEADHRLFQSSQKIYTMS